MSEHLHVGSAESRPRIPKREEVELRFSDKAVKELEALKSHYPDLKSLILPGLWIAQREWGWCCEGAIAEVAYRLSRAYAEVEGVATFYTMYDKHKPGRHKLEVCTCLTCATCGAYKLGDYLKKKLGVDYGETTADGEFTLEEVECLDACDRAPLMQVGDEYYGPLDEAKVDALLEDLRRAKEPTTRKLADAIVTCHLKATERA